MKETKKCPKCMEEVDLKAKICPHCRKKIGGTPTWVIVCCVIGVLILFGGIAGNIDTNDTDSNEKSLESKQIEYTKAEVDELEDALENNAAAAKETYKGKYLEITGKLGTIDSDLKYISLDSLTKEWDFEGIHCTLKNADARNAVKSLSKGQTITVKGKITDVGEVLGYYLDATEIIAQ